MGANQSKVSNVLIIGTVSLGLGLALAYYLNQDLNEPTTVPVTPKMPTSPKSSKTENNEKKTAEKVSNLHQVMIYFSDDCR
jgi:hypothetical protein